VQAAGDLPKILQHASHFGHCALQPLGQLAGSRCRLRLLQLQDERDQPLLGAVVQIALDPAAGGIADGHDPRPGRGQLGLGLRVGDRGRGQLGEAGQPRLGSSWAGRRSSCSTSQARSGPSRTAAPIWVSSSAREALTVTR
jgi:hypothetical protein